jgi:hypothetical protein
MVSRMLGVAPTIADSIIEQLSKPCDKAVAAGEGLKPKARTAFWLIACNVIVNSISRLCCFLIVTFSVTRQQQQVRAATCAARRCNSLLGHMLAWQRVVCCCCVWSSRRPSAAAEAAAASIGSGLMLPESITQG